MADDPVESSTDPAPAAWRLLAHPLRSRILAHLRLHGGATAADLARALSSNTGATSYHTRVLAEAGLVTEVSGPDLMIVTSPPGETRPLDPSQINRILTERSLYPFELGMERANLESVFLELTRTEHLGQTQLEATPEGGSR